MFISKKRWAKMEKRICALEVKVSKDLWDSNVVETFEYGRTTLRSMIRKMAAHMYKEETASRSNGEQPQRD